MRQQFFSDTIQGRFVKELLYTTPIPSYNTVRKGDMIFENQIYIYRTKIIKCLKRGIIGAADIEQRALFRNIGDYIFGKDYPKFTERFASNTNYYEGQTHKWLGRLLRCYRDIWDLDLMPFYNCFTEEYQSGLRITDTAIENIASANYRMIKVPVKYNKTYTIAIDCSSEVYIAPVLLSNNNLSKVVFQDSTWDLTSLLLENNIAKFTQMSYTQPVTYTVHNDSSNPVTAVSTSRGVQYTPTKAEFLSTYENQLYMLIQLPVTNQSSVCILEGDYTDLDSRKIYNYAEISKILPSEINRQFLSNLSLLQFSDNLNYAFSDRLIEFLLWNVICHKDEITDNVERVQQKLNFTIYHPTAINGVWDRELRQTLYNMYMSNKKYPLLDITGFVDKDIENYLRRQI